MRGGLGCSVRWFALRREKLKQRRKITAEAQRAQRTQRKTERSAGRLGALAGNLVAGFGGWAWGRWDAGWQDRGVERNNRDDNVGDHYWFGVDEDAVG